MSTKGTELLLSVILNEAAGGVKDLWPQLHLHHVILNGVKDLEANIRLETTDSSLTLRMTERPLRMTETE